MLLKIGLLPHLIFIPQKLENAIDVSSPHSLSCYLNIHISFLEKLTENEIFKKFSGSYGIHSFTAVSCRAPDEFTQHSHRVFQ